MSTARHSTLDTPLGPFTALVDAEGAVLASGWTDDVGVLLPMVHRGLRPADPPSCADLGEVTAAVAAFHDGDPVPARVVPVRWHGGPFVVSLWAAMRDIPAGAPITYGELAERAGRPGALRAAGAACARNATTLFVPCHRVRRANGGLGGFRWGTETKARLLEMEAEAAASAPRCQGLGAPSAP